MHPLDGPRAKVERAQSQVVALDDTLQAWFDENRYSVRVAEFDAQAGHHNLRVYDGPFVFPDDWGVVIGEIAHNLRSALDGLAWQLALLSADAPYRNTAFPIYLVGHTKRKSSSGDPIPHFWGKGSGLRLLQSINRRLWARIELFQPYKGGNGGRGYALFLLSELNNSDKHRAITVLATTIAGIEIQGVFGRSTLKRGVSLKLNAKIGHVLPLPEGGVRVLAGIEGGRPQIGIQHEVQVNTNLTPRVLFGDGCDAVRRLPVLGVLNRTAHEVSRVIESFTDKFPIQ